MAGGFSGKRRPIGPIGGEGRRSHGVGCAWRSSDSIKVRSIGAYLAMVITVSIGMEGSDQTRQSVHLRSTLLAILKNEKNEKKVEWKGDRLADGAPAAVIPRRLARV